MTVARNGGRAAVAAEPGRAKGPARRPGGAAAPAVVATPTIHERAFHKRTLIEEGHAAAFRIDAGGGWATGTLPSGAGENEIAKFLSEAIGLAKQMQAAMCGRSEDGAAAVQFLIADPQAGAARQSAIQVSVEGSGGTVVTLQPGGSGHLVAMLQHFLMALNLAPDAVAPRAAPAPGTAPGITSRARAGGWPYAPVSAGRPG